MTLLGITSKKHAKSQGIVHSLPEQAQNQSVRVYEEIQNIPFCETIFELIVVKAVPISNKKITNTINFSDNFFRINLFIIKFQKILVIKLIRPFF